MKIKRPRKRPRKSPALTRAGVAVWPWDVTLLPPRPGYVRPRAVCGAPNRNLSIEPENKLQYAPGFNGCVGDKGFINGNLRHGGIMVWSKEEAETLAEELLAWVYEETESEPAPEGDL